MNLSAHEAAAEARTVIASLRAGAPRSQRWRAALLPRSLGPRPVTITPAPAEASAG